jgi:hypothetical protein
MIPVFFSSRKTVCQFKNAVANDHLDETQRKRLKTGFRAKSDAQNRMRILK